VIDLPLWKIWKSVGMITFPIYGKSESHKPAMFQTTKQIILHSIILSFSDSHILWHILCGHGLCMDDQLKRQTCHVPSLIGTSWPHLAFGNCYRWSFYCAGSLTLVGSRKKHIGSTHILRSKACGSRLDEVRLHGFWSLILGKFLDNTDKRRQTPHVFQIIIAFVQQSGGPNF
jgi:hypothetical protein